MRIVGWAQLEGERDPALLREHAGDLTIVYPGGAHLWANCDDVQQFLVKLRAQGFHVTGFGAGLPPTP